MPDRLTRAERLRLVAELCPRYGRSRACDSHDAARVQALELLGPAERAEVTADWVLMRAIDRFAAGRLSLEELYRCRLLAYYMIFASGGEEWARWGVATGVRPGDFPDQTAEIDLDDFVPTPDGPPWQ